jgi:hypothetical protein
VTGVGSPPITDVSGGTHDPAVHQAEQLAANYDAAHALADTYDRAGNRMRHWGALGARTLANGDLLESSILSPGSFAFAEAAVLVATTGPDGILAESLGWEADSIMIRVTIAAYEEQDQLAHQAMEVLDYALGTIIGMALSGLVLTAIPVAIPVAIRAAPDAGLMLSLLPDWVKADLEDEGIDGAEDLLTWLNDHPDVERHLLNGGGGLLDGLGDGLWPGPGGLPFLPPFHATTEDAARSLAGLFGNEGVATVTDHDLPVPVAPTNLHDLMANLFAINGTDVSPQPDGAITIQQVTAVDGTVHYIVYAPGTDAAAPWHHDNLARDMPTNVNLIGGNDTTYGDGILQAMEDAGVNPDDPVLIVGHSQGGMQAVGLLSQDTGYNITNVVTAGSPTSQVDIPVNTSSHVLSFENSGDVIPLLNGEPNDATANHVTVQFDDSATPGFQHDLEHYVNGAEAADSSGNPDIDEQIASMDGFLNGSTTDVHGYVITR